MHRDGPGRLSKTIYAGTGESFASFEGDSGLIGFAPDGIRGAGLFVATDGQEWNQVASTTGSNFQYVNRLALAAQEGAPSVLLVATTRGIFRSEKADRSDLTATASNTLPGVDCANVDFDPTDPQKAIASGRLNGTAYYSTNGGKTWTPASHLGQWVGRVEVTYSAKDSQVAYLSVYKQVHDPATGQWFNMSMVYHSTDGGQSYQEMQTRTRDEQTGAVVFANPLGGQGDYDNVIWAGDKTNADLVVVGGIDLWRSRDRGNNFVKISAWDESPRSAHADHHVIVADPRYNGTTNRTVYFGNDGGLYRAADLATVGGPAVIDGTQYQHASGWESINNGYGVTQFYSAATNMSTKTVFAGAQDNGSLRFTTAAGPQKWFTVIGGDGGYCVADPTDPNIFYSEYVYADIQRSLHGGTPPAGEPNPDADNISGHFWNSTGPGDPHWDWKPAPFVIEDARDSDIDNFHPKANFIAPIAADQSNANRLYVGCLRLWRTDDARTPNTQAAGPTWRAIKSAISEDGFRHSISAIAVDAQNPKRLWVGHNNGQIFRTANATDPAPAWEEVSTAELPKRSCTRIVFDPHDQKHVYVTFGGYSAGNVWSIVEGPGPWKSLGASLPEAPVRALAVHPENAQALYVGTEVGLLASKDGGGTWSARNEGPTNCSVDDLFWVGKTLYVVTHGRGLYTIDQPSAGP
jgi:BNR/Asp-box repeat